MARDAVFVETKANKETQGMSTNNQEVIARGDRELTVIVKPGYHLAQVIAMMNMYQANIQGREIICYPESPSDGYYVLADIVSDQGGREVGQWARPGQQTRACSGSCSACGCACKCTSASCCNK
jgi:hypothetical protein